MLIDTLYVVNRAVKACYRQRRNTNRREIEYLMLVFSQFHSLLSYDKIQTACKVESVSGISTTFGSWLLKRSNICLTASLANGILISDNSLSCLRVLANKPKEIKVAWKKTFSSNILKSSLDCWNTQYPLVLNHRAHHLCTGGNFRERRNSYLNFENFVIILKGNLATAVNYSDS